MAILLADSGATKCEWRLLHNNRIKPLSTQGISPYFFTEPQIVDLIQSVQAGLSKNVVVKEVHYYGTGMRNPENVKLVRRSLKKVFKDVEIKVKHDLLPVAGDLNGT